ncbi:MAG TPA: hypothetical protein DEV78_02875 [Clostridiales bacterium]|nr:hypothetical protein [Clostridiales bacterium]
MKQCYQTGCFFNMPCFNPCQNRNCCNPFPYDNCNPFSPMPLRQPCCEQNNCFDCGCINFAIPIGLLIFAGGFLLGQNCN